MSRTMLECPELMVAPMAITFRGMGMPVIRAWNGSTKWDGCFDPEIDPLVVYEELMKDPQPHCGRYVVYVHWLHDTYGLDRPRGIVRTLEIGHPHHVPRIWNLLARLALTPKCRPNDPPPR